ELEPQRERLATLADLLAAVDVEQLDAVEQLAGAAAHDALHLGGGDVLADNHRYVLEHGGQARTVAVRLRPRRELRDRVRVELERRDRAVEIPRARDARVELADPAELATVGGQHRGRPARVEEGPVAGLDHAREAGGAEQSLDKRLGGVEVGRPRLAAPRAGRGLGEDAAEVVALVGGGAPAR